jgi:hypothetical protein
MNHAAPALRQRGSVTRALKLLYEAQALLTRHAIDLALLALRLPVAVVFWRSGRTRVSGWNIFHITDSVCTKRKTDRKCRRLLGRCY